jgi:hypothetical protein
MQIGYSIVNHIYLLLDASYKMITMQGKQHDCFP